MSMFARQEKPTKSCQNRER